MSNRHSMTREEKSIRENYFPEWFILGVDPVTSNVDLSNGEGDVFEDIPREAAELLIQARSEYTDAIVRICLEYGYEESKGSLIEHLSNWVIQSKAM